ncbi:hypothetical protein [Streptomyces lucensis]|uniref:hypothetical protein n=1 Tax=Streptomyces lucensis TaxID=67319 RepID=UPI0016785446|nr:hypothetical protein [Streptomyces lucensis]
MGGDLLDLLVLPRDPPSSSTVRVTAPSPPACTTRALARASKAGPEAIAGLTSLLAPGDARR